MTQTTTAGVQGQLSRGTRLLSDEPTIELVMKAREGDTRALEAIIERCLPKLRRWAHGRLPAQIRAYLDTGDLVQETVLHVLGKLNTFEVRHVGAMQAYLRQSVINRIRDEARRIGRRPPLVEVPENVEWRGESPLDITIRRASYQRYRDALAKLRPRDREVLIARIDLGWSVRQIAEHFGSPSVDAARRTVERAILKLKRVL